jgi:hypothetical protein
MRSFPVQPAVPADKRMAPTRQPVIEFAYANLPPAWRRSTWLLDGAEASYQTREGNDA